jgi:hypothetical protein
MKDLMTAAMVGKAFQKSTRWGRRFMGDGCPIAVYLIGNKRYVARDEFEAWLESRRIEPPEQREPTEPDGSPMRYATQRGYPSPLKQWVEKIAQETLRKRKAKEKNGRP